MADTPFFEPPPPPTERQPRPRRPTWAGPPENMLGAAVAVQTVIARTPELVIAVEGVVAYPQGFEFCCLIRHRRSLESTALMYGGRHPGRPDATQEGLRPEQFRLGVQFSDGTKATNVGGIGPRPAPGIDMEPPQAVMMPMGGGGGGHSWRQRLWVWPLPPPGQLSFVAEWPSEGVELSRVDIDAAAIRDAGEQAEVLWPADEEPPEPPHVITRGSGF
jgi:hypothetical protein